MSTPDDEQGSGGYFFFALGLSATLHVEFGLNPDRPLTFEARDGRAVGDLGERTFLALTPEETEVLVGLIHENYDQITARIDTFIAARKAQEAEQ